MSDGSARVDQETAATQPARVVAPLVDGPRTVAALVVEDDAAVCELVRVVLEDEGYTVFEAHDGHEALEYVRASVQSLVVLLDWWIPKLDGIQVLQVLARDSNLTARHAFILMTAVTDHPPIAEANLPPELAVSVLRKPFHLNTLLALVATASQQLQAVNG